MNLYKITIAAYTDKPQLAEDGKRDTRDIARDIENIQAALSILNTKETLKAIKLDAEIAYIPAIDAKVALAVAFDGYVRNMLGLPTGRYVFETQVTLAQKDWKQLA